MRVKTVRRNISEAKQIQGAFTVPFGDRTEFDVLRIELVYLSTGRIVIYTIASEFLPYNKGNATRFRIVDGQIRWCSKVAGNMSLLDN